MIILDACIVISFGTAGRLDLIDTLKLDTICVSARARTEVRKNPARAEMEASIAAGRLSVASIDLAIPGEQEALRNFDSRAAFRDRGDAEVLALATCRGYIVASDERAVRSIVIARFGSRRIAGTADFIVWAVREGRLTLAEAEGVLQQIDSGAAVLEQLKRQGRSLSDII